MYIYGQSAAKILKGIRFRDYLEREYWRNLGNGGNYYKMLIKIYILVDPISNQVRYVGKTCQSLSKRLNGHFFKKSRTHTSSWIKSLKSKNKIPIIELLDEVPEPEWIF